MSENNAGGTAETPEVIDWEARAKKAEAKIIDFKKSSESNTVTQPETNVETTPEVVNPNYMTRQEFEAERFFESNPSLATEKDFIMEKVKLGNSFEEAKWLAEKKDPTIYNKKKTNSMSMSGEAGGGLAMFSISDLEGMSQKEYNKATDMIAAGTAELVS